jgi:hypothetical protein
LRRLTSAEYDNAVADLLGDTSRPARSFPADNRIGLFDNTAQTQTVPVLLAEKYLESAAVIARNVQNLQSLVGCDYNAADAQACVSGFVERFGRRAYRRPLTLEESAGLVKIWNDTKAQSDAETGVRGVVAAVLVSPHFIFRPEFGAGPSAIAGAQQLSQFELAARLASLVWASVPDEQLLDAAAAGQLATREQVAAQAERMLGDAKARAAMNAFYGQWLGLQLIDTTSKNQALYPEFTDDLRADMREETSRFVEHVVWQGDSRATTLLTAPFSFVNSRLAALYGVSGPSSEDTFQQVTFPGERSGVLTQLGILTALSSPTESSPFKRGAWVRKRLLCQELPDPPNEVPELPEPQPGVSLRQRAAVHSSQQACIGCHSLIDGLGFGLEEFDALGRLRSMENGLPVDTSGEVTSTEDIDGAFSGGAELGARLASSKQVQACVATQWFRYSLARHETDEDACSLATLHNAFAASGGDLKKLMIELTKTDVFWSYRAPAAPEAGGAP